jgi:hypothetical protein
MRFSCTQYSGMGTMEGILLSQGKHSEDIVTDIEGALLVYPHMPDVAFSLGIAEGV